MLLCLLWQCPKKEYPLINNKNEGQNPQVLTTNFLFPGIYIKVKLAPLSFVLTKWLRGPGESFIIFHTNHTKSLVGDYQSPRFKTKAQPM